MFIHTYIDRYMNHDWFAAAFNADTKKLTEIKEWCYNTYGASRNTIYGDSENRWSDYIKYGEVYFYDERDLAIFLLKWA